MYRSQVSSMYNVLHNASPQHFCRKVAILYVQSSIYRLAGPSPFRIFKNKISLNLRKNVKFNQTIVLKDQLPANYFGFRFFFFLFIFFLQTIVMSPSSVVPPSQSHSAKCLIILLSSHAFIMQLVLGGFFYYSNRLLLI